MIHVDFFNFKTLWEPKVNRRGHRATIRTFAVNPFKVKFRTPSTVRTSNLPPRLGKVFLQIVCSAVCAVFWLLTENRKKNSRNFCVFFSCFFNFFFFVCRLDPDLHQCFVSRAFLKSMFFIYYRRSSLSLSVFEWNACADVRFPKPIWGRFCERWLLDQRFCPILMDFYVLKNFCGLVTFMEDSCRGNLRFHDLLKWILSILRELQANSYWNLATKATRTP